MDDRKPLQCGAALFRAVLPSPQQAHAEPSAADSLVSFLFCRCQAAKQEEMNQVPLCRRLGTLGRKPDQHVHRVTRIISKITSMLMPR